MADLPHLIYSHPFDYSTDEVMEWIHRLEQGGVIRYNSNKEPIETKDININDKTPSLSKEKYASIWFRKWDQVAIQGPIVEEDIADPSFKEQLPYFNQVIYEESKILHDYHYKKHTSKRILSRFFEISENKILVLQKAKEAGLDIPTSLVTKNKDSLLKFYEMCPQGVINKSITDHLMFTSGYKEEKGFSNYTEEITLDLIKGLPTEFGMSLFQEKLEKSYEIRTFYLDGKCYSMAIFSQANKETQLDSRRNINGLSNRRTVYQLNKEIEKKN